MTEIELENKLQELLSLYDETELVEFKEAKNDFNFDDIGKYFSALSNEANLKNAQCSWLVFGVNKNHKIVGTNYRKDLKKLHNLKSEIANHTANITFIEIYPLQTDQGRVILFQIPPAPQNFPVPYQNHYYARNDEKLTGLSLEKIQRIRSQNQNYDWSAQICEGATVDDLDEEALEMARNGYLEKQKKLKNQSQIYIVAKIDLKKEPKKFLKYAKMLTKEGELSNSCMLLLGKDKNVVECDFAGEIGYVEKTFGVKEVYTVPFQKAIIKVVNKISIKNIELPIKLLGEYTGNNKLLPNYTPDLLREFVANCVAHQDYSKRSRIKVIETIHKSIELINEGASLYSKQELEKFQIGNDIPDKYRNGALVNAMIEIGLMEAKGTGYNKLFQYNTKEVYLPLPKINWENTNQFEVKLYGAPLDKNFANILSQKTDLEPEVILVLDQVQKGFKMDKKIFNNLKRQGFVEGTPTKGILALNLEIMVSGVKAISKNNKRKEFDEEQCIKKIFSFIEACNKNSIQVKTSDIFDHIENDLTIREETEKKFNYLNNHIIKKMRNHPKYKIYSTKNGKSSSWLCII